MSHRLIFADVLDGLRQLDDESVQCIVTSPPYWNLRNYGTATWEGGDADCDHSYFRGGNGAASKKQVTSTGTQKYQYAGKCEKCGAVSVDRQIGLEPTISEYVEKMRDVFRECKRVLRNDGTLWLNLGDSYASNWACNRRNAIGNGALENGKREARPPRISDGVKEKDLCGIPWRVAFSLQDDGWYLRSDIIWAKPNPMPESVTDRPTNAHEHIFLLTKSQRYFYDADAIREPVKDESLARYGRNSPYGADEHDKPYAMQQGTTRA